MTRKASEINRSIREALPGREIRLLPGNYLMDETIELNVYGVRLVGDSIHNTFFQPAPGINLDEWVTVTRTDCEVRGIRFIPESKLTCIHVKGTNSVRITDNYFVGKANKGLALHLDQDGVPGAYNHFITENKFGYCYRYPDAGMFVGDIDGIKVTGSITSTIISYNRFISSRPIVLRPLTENRSGGANVIDSNLIQSWHLAAGQGVSTVGIDIENQSGNTITSNYFHGFRLAVRVGHYSQNTKLMGNHYDDVVTPVSLGSGGLVSSGGVSTSEYMTPQAAYIDDYQGIVPSSRCLLLHGNGALRRGCTLGNGVYDGHELRLMGLSWHVELVSKPTSLIQFNHSETSVVFGQNKTYCMDLLYYNGVWYELSRGAIAGPSNEPGT